jgi:hypothetical protein
MRNVLELKILLTLYCDLANDLAKSCQMLAPSLNLELRLSEAVLGKNHVKRPQYILLNPESNLPMGWIQGSPTAAASLALIWSPDTRTTCS